MTPRHTRLTLVALTHLLLMLCASIAMAQDATLSFSLAQSKGSATSMVHDKIEAIVDDMNFIKRPFARSKLKDGNAVCSKIIIKRQGPNISTQCESNGKVFTTPADGTKKKVIGSDNESEYILSQKLDGNTLVQVFRSENGDRTSTYVWDPAKKAMTLSIKLTSSKLPRPMTYSLNYRMN